MLEAKQLECVRQDRVVFSNLSFLLNAGQTLLIEGENGAGKTCLLRSLADLSPLSNGAWHWQKRPLANYPRHEFAEQFLYLGHRPGLTASLTVIENIKFLARLNDLSTDNVAAILDEWQLTPFVDQPVGQLSCGQQRRVFLSFLTLSTQPLWLLDEPFTGLDKAGQACLRRHLIQHCERGGLALITSHQVVDLPDSFLVTLTL